MQDGAAKLQCIQGATCVSGELTGERLIFTSRLGVQDRSYGQNTEKTQEREDK